MSGRAPRTRLPGARQPQRKQPNEALGTRESTRDAVRLWRRRLKPVFVWEPMNLNVQTSNIGLSCREAEPRDVDVLAGMNARLLEDEAHELQLSFDELKRRMSGWLEDEYRALLFERGASAVAYALLRIRNGELFLRQFYVERDARRAGIGREAIRLLWERFSADADRFVLDVLVHNQAALAFWHALGFANYAIRLRLTESGSLTGANKDQPLPR